MLDFKRLRFDDAISNPLGKSSSLSLFLFLIGEYMSRPRRCKCDDSGYKAIYDELMKWLVALGLDSYRELSQVQKDRLHSMRFIRAQYKRMKVTSNTLHTLRPKIKQELRDYLYVQFGSNPKAKQRIDDVLAKPKKSRGRQCGIQWSD